MPLYKSVIIQWSVCAFVGSLLSYLRLVVNDENILLGYSIACIERDVPGAISFKDLFI